MSSKLKTQNSKLRERPILCSTPVVESTLARRKTQTRRGNGFDQINHSPDRYKFHGLNDEFEACFEDTDDNELPWISPISCPYGKPGDLLWVRESWKPIGWDGQGNWSIQYKTGQWMTVTGGLFEDPEKENGFWEKLCDDLEKKGCPSKSTEAYQTPGKYLSWRPSIHMPKAAARIWLRVKDVRVERLQDISEQDAMAEGVESWTEERMKSRPVRYRMYSDFDNPRDPALYSSLAYDSFQSLWRLINGKDSWDDNPWVWVVEFEVVSTMGRPVKPMLSPSRENRKEVVI